MSNNRQQAAEVVASAVREEHDCRDSACDIRMAREQGYPFYAAWLLSGATETPYLDTVLAGMPEWRSWANQEQVPFAAWFRTQTVSCPRCEFFVEVPPGAQTVCSNCLTTIRRPAAA